MTSFNKLTNLEKKARIKDYYNFTKEDKDNLLNKLDNREKYFVNQLINEIKLHINNPFTIGISNEMLFNF